MSEAGRVGGGAGGGGGGSVAGVNEGGRKHVIFKVEQCAEHILSSN